MYKRRTRTCTGGPFRHSATRDETRPLGGVSVEARPEAPGARARHPRHALILAHAARALGAVHKPATWHQGKYDQEGMPRGAPRQVWKVLLGAPRYFLARFASADVHLRLRSTPARAYRTYAASERSAQTKWRWRVLREGGRCARPTQWQVRAHCVGGRGGVGRGKGGACARGLSRGCAYQAASARPPRHSSMKIRGL